MVKVKRPGAVTETSSLVDKYTAKETEAYEDNKKREEEIRSTYADLISSYSDGGAAKQTGLEAIAQGKTQAIGRGTQANISSGLYGTTVQSATITGANKAATSQRLTLEDILQQRTNQVKQDLASFIERIETPYPDYSALLEAVRAQSSVPTTNSRTVNSYSGFRSL